LTALTDRVIQQRLQANYRRAKRPNPIQFNATTERAHAVTDWRNQHEIRSDPIRSCQFASCAMPTFKRSAESQKRTSNDTFSFKGDSLTATLPSHFPLSHFTFRNDSNKFR
jgi:hypothetical protein